MAETRLTCPSCKAVLKTAVELPVGKSIKCPKCQGAIRVPGGPQPVAAPSKPAAAPLIETPRKTAPDDVEERETDEEERPGTRSKSAPAKSPPRKNDTDEDEDEEHKPFDEEEDEAEEERVRGKKTRKDKPKKPGSGNNKMWMGVGIGSGGIVAIAVVLIIILSDKSEKGRGGKGDKDDAAELNLERSISTEADPDKPVARIVVSRDGSILAIPRWNPKSTTASVRTIDAQTGKTLARFDALIADFLEPGIVLSPDNNHIACQIKEHIEIHAVKSGDLVQTLTADIPVLTQFRNMTFAPKGDVLFCAAGEEVLGWECTSGRLAYRWKTPHKKLHSLAARPDGKTFVTGGDESIIVWDLEQKKPVTSIATGYKKTRHIAVSPDGKHAATMGFNSPGEAGDGPATFELWDLDGGRKERVLTPKERTSSHDEKLYFLRDDAIVVKRSSDHEILDANSGKVKTTWRHRSEDRRDQSKRKDDEAATENGQIVVLLQDGTVQFYRLGN